MVTAGQDGVAAPKRTRTVNPVYPQEALAQGIRGIVILEVLIDPQGKVTSAQIIRSIPGLDEAALEAVRKWEYEVTKVGGQPVSVKLTVPITFAMKVPEVTRGPGIPELRQGANIQYPAGQTEAKSVTAEVTLAPDGQVAEAEVVKGEAPFSIALLTALRTWRFAPEGEGVVLSFRVEADFVPARGDKARVDVRLTGLRRSEGPGRRRPTAGATRSPADSPLRPPPARPGPRGCCRPRLPHRLRAPSPPAAPPAAPARPGAPAAGGPSPSLPPAAPRPSRPPSPRPAAHPAAGRPRQPRRHRPPSAPAVTAAPPVTPAPAPSCGDASPATTAARPPPGLRLPVRLGQARRPPPKPDPHRWRRRSK